MTNYNERLDEVLGRMWLLANTTPNTMAAVMQKTQDVKETKQAITSLTKELVAEAKPKTTPFDNNLDDGYATDIRSNAINEFEQNLLKELEEQL